MTHCVKERDRERVVTSCLSFNISGYTNEFSGSARVSCSSSSVSSHTVNCSDIVPENITANVSPEQPTHCCSSQPSMSTSSSLTPEESSHSYKKGRYFCLIFFIKTLSPNISFSFTRVLTAVDSPAFCIFCTATSR